jgi:hypothetical protein
MLEIGGDASGRFLDSSKVAESLPMKVRLVASFTITLAPGGAAATKCCSSDRCQRDRNDAADPYAQLRTMRS